MKYDPFMYGKNATENIVNISLKHGMFHVFQEWKGEIIETEFDAHDWYLVAQAPSLFPYSTMNGTGSFKYLIEPPDSKASNKVRQTLTRLGVNNLYGSYGVSGLMLREGYTYFKGMKVDDVSVLAFDIETTGFHADRPDSKCLIIANTFRKNGKVIRKMFSVDNYASEGAMLYAWCQWVQKIDPSIMIGHNIYVFDFPYLNARYNLLFGTNLELGRDGSPCTVSKYVSEFRKDGSQTYSYNKTTIFGREIIDTWMLMIRYDIKREFPSYGLKEIIDFLGKTAKDRQFYDASKIGKNWHIPEEREKIKKYAEFDGDDAMTLYDLGIPALFYLTQHIPKTFGNMGTTATGAQLNAFLIRSYLQNGHAIPEACMKEKYQGAISFGIPGVYQNTLSIDVASLYPSIMIQYQVQNEAKDPDKHFYKMVETFTKERFKNKKLFEETGDSYYDDLQASQKIVINSAYGLLGAPGLNFNSPKDAAFVTMVGREVLEASMLYFTGYGIEYWSNKNVTDEEVELTENEIFGMEVE